MKLNGTHKFKANSQKVFHAILDPKILQASIQGCESVQYLDPNRIRADISVPLPGLKGPLGAIIQIVERQEPNALVLQVQREGRGGSINAVAHIHITDEADGALLTYDANAELGGPIAVANNPIGQGITKSSLKSFFEKLDSAIA